MVDKEVAAAIKNLAAARANVGGSLQALEVVSQGPVNEKITPIASGLAEATVNLLTSLRQTVTTLALSFKPPLTAAGISRYLDKATDEVGRLVSCVVTAAAGNGKSVLVEEWKDGIEAVGREVERLIAVLEEGVCSGTANNASSSASESPYLAHTGMVWDVIDRLKARLPADERSAVTQRWEVQKETVRDAWSEFKEMLEDAAEDGDDEDEDEDDGFGGMDDDDEWGELEKAMNASMNATERKRAEASKPLFGLHQILHATLPRYFSLLQLEPEAPYTPLLLVGSDLVAAFDTAVSSLYPKQDVAEIYGAVEHLNEAGRALAAVFKERMAKSVAPEDKKAAAAAFVDKWSARLETEAKGWSENNLGMSELAAALE